MERGAVTPETWLRIIETAYSLFDDLEARGLGKAPFVLGGGTVLMLDYRHRLSKDIDFFTYDVRWVGYFSPRLNERAAELATDYVEQANSVKIVTKDGDIDFIAANDLTPAERRRRDVAAREMVVEPPAEILAKKLFYRAATLQPRDVYDMSTVIDLDQAQAEEAARAATSKRGILLRRLDDLAARDPASLMQDIIPYDGTLAHADRMIAKVRDFLARMMHGPASGQR